MFWLRPISYKTLTFNGRRFRAPAHGGSVADLVAPLVNRLTLGARGTSGAAPHTAPQRLRARSTAGRTDASPPTVVPARRAPAARRTCLGRPPCRRTPTSEDGAPRQAVTDAPPIP